ncbi:MAG: apolipoprotein N-acyltransferase, partial [Treponema sp.]|nr:apolipoprotein N-acyltransferase [Treponema sp.]
GFYGALSYILYVSWLVTFSPSAAFGIIFQYFILYAILFVVLKLAFQVSKNHSYLCMYFVLCAFEYLKTLGFAGFSYGVSGYTQYKNLILLQSASLFGVWALTFLIDFSSMLFAQIISESKSHTLFSYIKSVKNHKVSFSIFVASLLAFYVGGAISLKNSEKDFSRDVSFEKIKVCAIQHNSDPWEGGISSYEKDVKTLMRLTDDAFKNDSDIKVVVWPETAVIPSILTHYTKREDNARFNLIYSVLKYIDSKDAFFVIGNFHSVENSTPYTDDYNSAFVFTPKKNTVPPNPEIYSKVHLVPFTEKVPFGKKLDFLYEALLNMDTHLWESGRERVVFKNYPIPFSVPICFEDTFGNDCRLSVKNGARSFFNMSNDAWSKSLACQNQHLAMAVFRSVENRIPSVRSTASGQTCVIDVNGRIVAEAKPFTETYITCSLPLPSKNAGNTLYDKCGDFLAWVFVVLAFLLFVLNFFCKKNFFARECATRGNAQHEGMHNTRECAARGNAPYRTNE